MDKVIEFKYAFGSLEEIREGGLDRLATTGNVLELEPYFESSGLIIPKIVGVYQREGVVFQGETEKEYSEHLTRLIQRLSERLEELAERIKREEGLEDKIAHNLICVGYEPKQIPRDILRNYFSDARVKICDWREMPSFYEKQTWKIIEIMDEWTEICEADIKKSFYLKGDEKKRALEVFSSGIQTLSQQQEEYGLTTQESVFLNMIRDLRRVMESKITSNPLLINLFSEILEIE